MGMKSLEIVNEMIEDLKSRLESANYLANGNPSEFGKQVISDLEKKLKKYIKIQQSLEVLEILKKYLYIVENQIPRTDDYFEVLETDLDEMQDDENCDDFHKVKQWLEENENER